MRYFLSFFSLIAILNTLSGQELYIMNEPASNIPKGVLGIRLMVDGFTEVDSFSDTQQEIRKNMFALRLMYGISAKWMVMATAMVSNHHDKDLPADFITPQPDGTGYLINNHLGHAAAYPYRFNGVQIYTKYRFYTYDTQNQHLRLAAYAAWFQATAPHHLAEPSLMGYSQGSGAGLIATWLQGKMATSFTGGFTLPQAYERGQGDERLRMEFGRALNYNLSLGYLLYPKTYNNYKQTNINLYVEVMGRSYGRSQVFWGSEQLDVRWYPDLLESTYVEIYPGLQFIFNSNLRIDLTTAIPVIRRTYRHSYPYVSIMIQRYFFPK